MLVCEVGVVARHLSGCLFHAAHRAYSRICSRDLEHFRTILPHSSVITDPDVLRGMNEDWLGQYVGQSTVALRPTTTSDVSKILGYCNEKEIPVSIQGGNTGLVGGSVPVKDEVIINMSLMNRITSFDKESAILTCQAGCILANLESYLNERNFIMPIDLGAKGTCQIGGNVATNAGGLRLLRYGSLHGTVLGVEAVLADGTVFSDMCPVRKNNTGYDLKQLFIGSEGTLGVITEVAIVVPPKPLSVNVAMFACREFSDVLKALLFAKQDLGEILSAFEFIDRYGMDISLKQLGLDSPLPLGDAKFIVVCETSGSNAEHDVAKLNQFMENVVNTKAVEDGIVASSEVQAASLWNIRETVSESTKLESQSIEGCKLTKFDVSVPQSRMYDIVEILNKKEIGTASGYGHIGDGNLHLSVLLSSEKLKSKNNFDLYRTVFEWVQRMGGSVSAEHGVGQQKRNYLHYTKDKVVLDLMRKFKSLLDPKMILNPYKMFGDVKV